MPTIQLTRAQCALFTAYATLQGRPTLDLAAETLETVAREHLASMLNGGSTRKPTAAPKKKISHKMVACPVCTQKFPTQTLHSHISRCACDAGFSEAEGLAILMEARPHLKNAQGFIHRAYHPRKKH